VLTGVFHERIEYPDVAIPPRAEGTEEANAEGDEAKGEDKETVEASQIDNKMGG
jgi:hypothetical protein